jgi:hypothetical protein
MDTVIASQRVRPEVARPDDRLREAIQGRLRQPLWIASSP